LPERPSSACSSSTLRGDLRTSAPGAYLPAVSASGTCAYRRAARAARRPDLMDKPSLQTISSNKPARGGPQRCTAGYARCSSYPQEPDGCTASQDSFAGKALAVLGYFQARTPLWLEAPCEHRNQGFLIGIAFGGPHQHSNLPHALALLGAQRAAMQPLRRRAA
jgi:hypothetical protein